LRRLRTEFENEFESEDDWGTRGIEEKGEADNLGLGDVRDPEAERKVS
jgi:hypothetical protein